MYVNARALIERSSDAKSELLIQRRNKSDDARTTIELPGGRIEEYESLIAALKREVKEETGLDLVWIEGQELSLTSQTSETSIECLPPFAAYQTTHGPVDSMGLYFRCRAEGHILEQGDGTKDIRWIEVSELARHMQSDIEQFSWVDRVGMMFYLKQAHGIELTL
jgi:8-oxo-dGTP diphosphatase